MTKQDDLEDLFALDAAPGPARPVDDARAAAIIAAAIGGAGLGPGGGGGGRAGKLALVAGAGTAIAIVAWLATRESPTPPPPVAAVAPTVEVAPPAEVAPPIVEKPAVVVQPPPPAKPVHLAPRAEDLLAEANGERIAHHWREADALYARVVALPHAPKLSVQTALVASASLHLEHLGDPRGATRRFHAALDGALAEDARWGLAEAARASNDPAAERAALDDFLAHHPDSALAPTARTRRAAL